MVDRTTANAFPTRLVAYLDILGWKSRTLKGENVDLLAACKEVDLWDGLRVPAEGRPGHSFRTSRFSDSIVYSCEPTPDEAAGLVNHLQHVCLALLFRGHYVRGGISVGPLNHSTEMIAGTALLEAIAIEQKVAKYPRVVVSDEAAKLILPTGVSLKDPTPETPLRLDDDRLVYLHLFALRRARGGWLLHVREQIRADFERPQGGPGDHAEALNCRAKFGWMLTYLDKTVGEEPDAYAGRAHRPLPAT